jgi:hypothetical protein
VSPDGCPRGRSQRDLIGARTGEVTPHSIVRTLLLLGWKVTAPSKGAWDVTMIGAERPETKVEVILGVDTHLDFHVAVAIDHLGRRLGESSVPTTVKGYEELLCWAEGFGPVRCAGGRDRRARLAPRSAGSASRPGALVSLSGIGADHAATLLIVALKTTPRG